MSAEDQMAQASRSGQDAGQPSEEELRAAYEAELSRISTTDMMAQAAVSLLNLGARRLAPADERDPAAAGQRDLAQARDAIDGVRALLEILERSIPQELGPLRDALSRLQMAYAREMQITGAAGQAPGAAPGGGPGPHSGGAGPAGGADGSHGQPAQPDAQPGAPGPAETSGRLWVPGR
ncbi:MAG TPA: hypothetical protein VIH92_07785 [Solirubrobacteraceae bacterium]